MTKDQLLIIGAGGLLASGKDTFADHLVANHGFVKLGMSDVLAEALYRLNPWIVYGNGSGDFDPSSPAQPVEYYDLDQKRAEVDAKPWFLEEGSYGSVRYQAVADLIGYVEAKKHPEVRRLLQVLGTEVGRELLGQNIWVDAARRRIMEQRVAGNNVIITGIRFPNEIGLIRKLAEDGLPATSVWVKRPAKLVGGTAPQHASETSVGEGDFEYTLNNDGTIADLYSAGERLLHTIQKDFA